MSILCNQGYIINKNDISKEKLSKIKKELKVRPFVQGSRGRFAKSFKIYRENDTKICLPKFYGLKNLPPPKTIDIREGDDISLKFAGSLRDYQQKVIDETLPKIKNHEGGLISLPPGRGKTVIACKLISDLSKKTLVIVHKTFLLSQWKKRIEQFLPDARVGLIQGPKVDIEDKDIVIAMLQSISLKDDYPDDMFYSFGSLIIDESHHISAEKFSKALRRISVPYMIGLSATPFRNDKLEKVLNYHIGDVLYYEKPQINQEIEVNIYKFNMEHKKFIQVVNKYTKEAQVSTMITNLSELSERNKFIINIIKKTRECKDRKLLVLTDRRNHIEFLLDKVGKLNIGSVSKYVGGMKQAKLDIAEEADIIFSTYSMSSEALDISSLNSVILSTPRRNVEQSTGRILRKQKGNYVICPLIIDIVDKLPVFTSQSYTRKAYYKKITKLNNIINFKYEKGKIIEEKKKKQETVVEESNDVDLFVDSDSD